MSRLFAGAAALTAALALGSPALAWTVRDCDGITDAARTVVSSAEDSRTFYTGGRSRRPAAHWRRAGLRSSPPAGAVL